MIAHYLIELFIVGVDILILWEKSYVVEGMNVDSTHTYMLSYRCCKRKHQSVLR